MSRSSKCQVRSYAFLWCDSPKVHQDNLHSASAEVVGHYQLWHAAARAKASSLCCPKDVLIYFGSYHCRIIPLDKRTGILITQEVAFISLLLFNCGSTSNTPVLYV